MGTFPHPLYSPDLVPCDYHLFLTLKDYLGGKRFLSEAELGAEISLFFSKMDLSFYHLGLEKLVSRYNKCLDLQYLVNMSKNRFNLPTKFFFLNFLKFFWVFRQTCAGNCWTPLVSGTCFHRVISFTFSPFGVSSLFCHMMHTLCPNPSYQIGILTQTSSDG